jgi:hypothetical protein
MSGTKTQLPLTWNRDGMVWPEPLSAEIEWRGGEIPAHGDGHAITYSLQPYLEPGRSSRTGGGLGLKVLFECTLKAWKTPGTLRNTTLL